LPAWRIALLALPVGLGLALIIAGVFFALFITHYGDRPPVRNMRVENQTDATVVITADVWIGGTAEHPTTKRFRLAVVPSNRTILIEGRCDLRPLTARDRLGSVIATHEPTRICDKIVTWVIGP
jgi:hypothetical protein